MNADKKWWIHIELWFQALSSFCFSFHIINTTSVTVGLQVMYFFVTKNAHHALNIWVCCACSTVMVFAVTHPIILVTTRTIDFSIWSQKYVIDCQR